MKKQRKVDIIMSRETVYLSFEAGKPFANSQYFAYGDYRLHYRIDPAKGAEKAKMFMLHGFGCDTTFYDELVEQYVAAGIKCVRVDLPDFGYSTREKKGINYVPQIEMLFALMDELDTDKSGWIIVGHSMGGSVTLQMANQDASRFNAIILNAPLLMANVPDFVGPIMLSKPMTKVLDAAFKFVSPYDWIWKLMTLLMTFNPIYSLNYDAKKFSTPYMVKDAGTGLCYMTSKTKVPDLKELHKITCPVQLVTGQCDLFVFPTKAKQLRNALPAGYDDHSMKLGGHCFLQDKSKATAKLGLDFLRKNNVI